MKLFNFYLMKRAFVFSFFILAVFGLIDLLFNFMSELENITERYLFLSILDYVLRSMPHRMTNFLEGACLLGTMLSLGLSHQEGNLNVLRSAGYSPIKIISITALGSIVLVFSLLMLDELAFKKMHSNAQINKYLLSDKKIDQDTKWVRSGNSYLGYSDISGKRIINPKLIILDNQKNITVLKSDIAKIDKDSLVFNKNEVIDFILPIQSRISFKNISYQKLSKIYEYRSYFKNTDEESEMRYKLHLDKFFYKTLFLPFSIFILILFFGSFIFTSLRESNLGIRITISVLGAFLYKLSQDLSIGIFISYNLSVLIGVVLPAIFLLLFSIKTYRDI